MDHPSSLDQEQPEHISSSHNSPSRSSRVGSAVRWTLASVLAAGGAGGVGYTVHRQNELAEENSAMRKTLSEEQMRREGIQRRLDTQVTLDDMGDAVELVTPATARVEGRQWLGSGVIITDRLGRMYILTNSHVTEQNEIQREDPTGFRDGVYRVTVYTGNDFKKGVSFDAAPVMRENGKRAYSSQKKRDLSLLRIPTEVERQILEGKFHIPSVTIGNRVANPARAGDPVIAVGNPFGERDHVTYGIISNSDAFGDIEPENAFIRTSAPINGGNSGGGLFRVRRENGRLITELVGINTWGYRGGDGVSGAIDIRVVALQCHEWGIPIVSDEEIATYQRWWKEVVEPFQRARGIGGDGSMMPPADD